EKAKLFAASEKFDGLGTEASRLALAVSSGLPILAARSIRTSAASPEGEGHVGCAWRKRTDCERRTKRVHSPLALRKTRESGAVRPGDYAEPAFACIAGACEIWENLPC